MYGMKYIVVKGSICHKCGKMDNTPLCSQCRECGTYINDMLYKSSLE